LGSSAYLNSLIILRALLLAAAASAFNSHSIIIAIITDGLKTFPFSHSSSSKEKPEENVFVQLPFLQ